MNAQELRTLQAPLKDKYRGQPEAACAMLSAQGQIHVDRLTVEILREGPPPQTMGLHPMAGGDGTSACAAQTLLEALVGCAGVTLAAVCTAMEIPVQRAACTAQGTLDFRGTLGVNKEIPIGFQEIRLTFELNSDASSEALSKAVQLAERYCVVAQTLRGLSVDWARA